LNNLLINAFFFAILFCTSQLAAKSVTVNGYGAIIDGNISDARTNALEDAKRVAVEQLLGSFVSSRTETRNFMLASEQIYSTTRGRLDSYRIIEEGAVDDSTFKLSIEANVDQAELVSDAVAVLSERNWLKKPRVKIVSRTASGAHAKTIQRDFIAQLTNSLKREGFTVVSPEQQKSISASFTVNSDIAVEVSESEYQGMKIQSNQLLVSTTLTTTDTAVVVSSSSEAEDAAGMNQLKALKKIATKISKRVARRISIDTKNTWLSNKSFPVILTVVDPAIERVAAIQHFLQNELAGLSQITIESKSTNSLKLLGAYQGWPEQLFDQLSQLSKHQEIPFVVLGLQGPNITLGAKSKEN
jgi:hypothetical protein